MPIRLTKAEEETIQWARVHRANIETRNKIIIGIFIIADIILFAGYINYYVLLPLTAGGTSAMPNNTFWVQQLFAELGLLLPLLFINTKIIINIYNVNNSDPVVGVMAATVTAATATMAMAMAMVTATVAMAMVVVVAMIVIFNISHVKIEKKVSSKKR